MSLPDLSTLSIGADADEIEDDLEDINARLQSMAEVRDVERGRALVRLIEGAGLQSPAAQSIDKGATLVAKLLTYPHNLTEQQPGPWSSPPTNAFPQALNFIGVLMYLRRMAVYPSDYSEILDLRTFEHWNATRLIPSFLLGMELAHATETLQDESAGYEGKGYYVRRDFSGCRVFVLGDSHGSLHSMVDILMSMATAEDAFNPYEDDDGLVRLQYNVRVVFLGDILDRSPYTLECLYLVLRLMRENPGKVVFLAGNHETHTWLWSRESGSMHEMEGEYANRVNVPHFPFLDGKRPMNEVVFDLTSRLPAALIARTVMSPQSMPPSPPLLLVGGVR